MIDFIVVGGGIAGVSAAAHLSQHGSVTLLEAESSLAYHTTGRSAALFIVNYGAQGFRPLARASQRFLENPPEWAVEGQLLSERGLLWIGNSSQMGSLHRMAEDGEESGANSRIVDADEAIGLVPVLRPDAVSGGLLEPDARDIDVAGLHQAFVRIARSNDCSIATNSRVDQISREVNSWAVSTSSGTFRGRIVVNASGAWGDEVAVMAGARPVGLRPLRRTAFMVKGRPEWAGWPMVVDADQLFYFKADGEQILCSLAEEEPSEPTDPRPRLEDVAMAIQRINEATTLGIRSVNTEWTGLRTFAPDRELVAGEDPRVEGFYWLVGQGGTGIQTAPAYGALIAALITGQELPEELNAAGVDPSITSPARFDS